jgi:DNA modification methylase
MRVESKNYTMFNGDCVTVMKNEMEENSMDMSVFSLPFADLFVYSSEKEDMGNCRDASVNHDDPENKGEFYYNWRCMTEQLFRVMKPGTVTAIHLAQLRASFVNHGFIGIRDFWSTVRAGMANAGFDMFGEFVIKKNQQAVGIRTHASTLVMVTHGRDTRGLAPCYNDYVVLFKKPGSAVPVNPPRFTKDEWVNWAAGVWTDVRETDVLQVRGTKEDQREKHICPLQLSVIERLIRMYSNEGETVFTPFMGIGSEVHEALRLGNRAVGVELKKSYFDQAVRNIKKLGHAEDTEQLSF